MFVQTKPLDRGVPALAVRHMLGSAKGPPPPAALPPAPRFPVPVKAMRPGELAEAAARVGKWLRAAALVMRSGTLTPAQVPDLARMTALAGEMSSAASALHKPVSAKGGAR